MHWLSNDTLQFLSRDILVPLILSTVATLIYLLRSGWHGIANCLASWCIACFVGVLTHWTLSHYGIGGTIGAVIISMAALLSHMVMDIIFHPQLREAVKKRLAYEVMTFGRGRGK